MLALETTLLSYSCLRQPLPGATLRSACPENFRRSGISEAWSQETESLGVPRLGAKLKSKLDTLALSLEGDGAKEVNRLGTKVS